jgi:hypothetical protein
MKSRRQKLKRRQNYGLSRMARQFSARMEQRRQLETEAEPDYRSLRRGWCYGGAEFRQELIGSALERVGPSHSSDRRHETQENKAERIVQEELKRIGWGRVDLASRAKGAHEKVALAARLRQETTMTLQWIATRLKMGTWTHVSNLLNAKGKTAP